MKAFGNLKKTTLVGIMCCVAVTASYFIVTDRTVAIERQGRENTVTESTGEGLKVFESVRSVLQSPRCQNCHIPGNAPLQGDKGKVHSQDVRRGKDGRGTPDTRCTDCHEVKNSAEPHMPPGAPDWRLPEPSMPLVFIGLPAGKLCRNLKNPIKNGGKSLEDLVKHVSGDPFVLWGWNPGPGRTVPPLSHQEFIKQFTKWVTVGAPCPEK